MRVASTSKVALPSLPSRSAQQKRSVSVRLTPEDRDAQGTGPRGIRTPLSDLLKPLNSEYGKVVPGIGTTWLMVFFIVAFIIFQTILLQIWNG